MTAKQYTDNEKRKIDSNLTKIKQRKEKSNRLYNLATIFTGVMGACLLFGNPLLGIPMLGVSASFYLGKNNLLKSLDRSEKRLNAEKKHIEDMVQKGVNISPNVNAQRKVKIDTLEKKRQCEEAEYLSSESKKNFANCLVAGTTAVAWIFMNPILSILPCACAGIKYLADKNYLEKHDALDKTNHELHDLIHEYNVSVYANRSRGNASRSPQRGQTMQRGNTVRRVVTPPQRVSSVNGRVDSMSGYDSRDVKAVDEYVNQLAKDKNQTKGVQKKKI